MIYIQENQIHKTPVAMFTTTAEGLNLPAEQPQEQPPANSYASIRDALLRLGIKATYRAIQSDNFVTGSAGWKIPSDGSPEFNDVTVRGTIYATLGEIGGFTITATELYGGIIKTALTVGADSTGVIMDTDGLRGYDSVLGKTFDLPTDGSAPTFSSGIINETIYEISTNAVLRTSATVGDGSASSAGVLINNTGVYVCGANQAVAAANFKALIDGSVNITGVITLSATSSGIANLTDGGDLVTKNEAEIDQTNLINAAAAGADVTLSAINGGLAVTGGGITLSSGGSIKGGQTAYATGTGFFLGYEASKYKFSIGSSTKYFKWDGTNITWKGTNTELDASGNLIATGGTITAGTVRTAASGARVEMNSSNNRLDIWNSTPTNIGWFGGAGANGNFMYINQPYIGDTYPPVYLTSANNSNVINGFNTRSAEATYPALRFESNGSAPCVYFNMTGAGMSLQLETGSSGTYAAYMRNYSNSSATLQLVNQGTGNLISGGGGYLNSAGNFIDGSSKKLKENFEDVTVLEKVKKLEIKKYTYIIDRLKTREKIEEDEINREKRKLFIKKYGNPKKISESEFDIIKESSFDKVVIDKIKKKTDIRFEKEKKREVEKYISPMAEDFYEIFGIGDNKGIAAKNLAGVALQAIKELTEKVEALERKIT